MQIQQEKESEGSDFKGNLKFARSRYARNPNAHDDALPVAKASPAALKAGRSASGTRRSWDYIKNPSSADDRVIQA